MKATLAIFCVLAGVALGNLLEIKSKHALGKNRNGGHNVEIDIKQTGGNKKKIVENSAEYGNDRYSNYEDNDKYNSGYGDSYEKKDYGTKSYGKKVAKYGEDSYEDDYSDKSYKNGGYKNGGYKSGRKGGYKNGGYKGGKSYDSGYKSDNYNAYDSGYKGNNYDNKYNTYDTKSYDSGYKSDNYNSYKPYDNKGYDNGYKSYDNGYKGNSYDNSNYKSYDRPSRY